MQPIIQVRRISKKYMLGQSADSGATLRELMMRTLQNRFRRASRPRATSGHTPVEADFIWALKDVDFEVQPGEVLGIVGRNGSGKSTLLKILSRITDPTSGQITMRGRLASLLEVGTGFHPELTGRENVYLNGSILGLRRSEINAVFDEIVAFAEIDKFLDTPVKRYSSGMYVRLAFAVAAHLKPDILVVDEVLAVGDAAFQKKCLGKMSQVANQGRTVLFVSHNMAAVSQLCTKAIWLHDGQLRSIGTPEDIIRTYLAEGSEHVCQRHWPDFSNAPGDDRIRLRAVRLIQHTDATSILDINEPCSVEFAFDVLRDAHNLITGINVYNQDGVCLFANCDWRPNHLEAGHYRKWVQIPRQTLAEGTGTILVQLVFWDPDVKSVVLPEALTFEAMDSDDPHSVRGAYKGKWPGVVRLALNWSDAALVQNRDYALPGHSPETDRCSGNRVECY